MYKIERVKRLLDCDLCNEVIIDPVAMAYGFSICKTHLDKLITNGSNEKSTFICEICQEDHLIPKKGFMVNHRFQSLLEIEFNTLKAGPVFDECMKEIDDAKENVDKIEFLEKNAENYIYDYFEDVKRQVDIEERILNSKLIHTPIK